MGRHTEPWPAGGPGVVGVVMHSLGPGDELVGLVPVGQQVRGFLVVHADVVVLKEAREEVVDLPGDVQDVLNPEGREQRRQS